MSTTKYFSKLANTRVFVLGGTSGIGFCVAEAAIEHGALVTVASSRQEKLDATVARLQAAYPQYKDNIDSCRCDLADVTKLESNIEAALKFAAGEGKIDHIVFTATPPLQRPPLAETTPENVRSAGDARLVGSLMLAKHALRYMNPSAASSLTLTSGVNTDKPSPGWSVLAAYGGAIYGMTRGLAVDMKPIRVNTVSPGAIDTELLRQIPNFEAFSEMVKGKTLTGSVGQPEDTAEAYLYLMKDRFVTGTVVETNGGWLLA